jgi:peroxiredoxin Q/BCP
MKFVKILGLAALVGLFVFCAALTQGQDAPDFTAKNQDGKDIHLADYRGKFVLLYFYPKDDTPGCTKEACQFRDGFAQFTKHNAIVFGISKQSAASHRAFITAHKLPFDLLVDTNEKVADAYGITTIMGMPMFQRDSVLISPKGKIAKIYKNVDPDTHSKQVLQDIQAMQGGLQ